MKLFRAQRKKQANKNQEQFITQETTEKKFICINRCRTML